MPNPSRQPRIQIRRHNGQVDGYHTTYCPKCSEQRVESAASTSPTFNEKGWYYPITLTCQNPSCKHQWVEQQLISQ